MTKLSPGFVSWMAKVTRDSLHRVFTRGFVGILGLGGKRMDSSRAESFVLSVSVLPWGDMTRV